MSGEDGAPPTAAEEAQMALRRAMMAVQADPNLSDAEKARRRQDLLMGRSPVGTVAASAEKGKGGAAGAAAGGAGGAMAMAFLDETLKCAICHDLCDRPVTAPCQHNLCLNCFVRLTNGRKSVCPTCRAVIPEKIAANPRINYALANTIRQAKKGELAAPNAAKKKLEMDNAARPDQSFTTDRAKRAGKANAASGRIMVTCPRDHFGPIGPEHDPERSQGVIVGEQWSDRLECRQWGAHLPHVAGIAGQAKVGAQSVALSGGYEDDIDHGEWFLYTGSGGRDLTGNKRVNKVHSKDQEFDSMNEALRVSCLRGLPVRVVRSWKEKRGAYAPSPPNVRYDGVYRIEKCWRVKGAHQEWLMCRYLFVRCDNSPAPWSSNENGEGPWATDKPGAATREPKPTDVPGVCVRPMPAIEELDRAVNITERPAEEVPYWGWDDAAAAFTWRKPQPPSQAGTRTEGGPDAAARAAKRAAADRARLLKDYGCKLCRRVLVEPVSTPCAHHFCRSCLAERFEGEADLQDRARGTGRSLRAVAAVKKCPSCKADIADVLRAPTVNKDMEAIIAKLQLQQQQQEQQAAAAGGDGGGGGGEEEGDGDGDDDAKDGEGPGAAAATPARKKQRQSAAAAASSAAAVGSPGATMGSVAGGRGAPAPAGGAYAVQSANLRVSFPQVDGATIDVLLEDQGGDEKAVSRVLKTMADAKPHKAAKAPAAKAPVVEEGGEPTTAATGKAKGGGRPK